LRGLETGLDWPVAKLHPGRVFVSCSRKDGAAFARDLCAMPEKEGHSV
jgi:hypothetical protein